MEKKLVKIVNEMAEYLNISQLKKLQEVLVKQLSENEPQRENISNQEYMIYSWMQSRLKDVL